MPPEDPNKPPSWLEEVDQTVKNVVEKQGGLPGPFDWVVFTNIPHQFGEPGGADPSRHWAEWLPRTTRIPPAINQAVIAALRQYGISPEFETGS